MEEKSCIKFYPNINVDYLKIEKTISTLSDAVSNFSNIHSTTVFINDFTENINAKYFPSSAELENTTLSIYRKTYYQTYYDYLCTLDNNQIFFKDHNVVNNEYYHYLTSAEITTNGTVEYLTFENKDNDGNESYIYTNWNKISICDIIETNEDNVYEENGDIWLFNNNLSGGDVEQNLSVSATQTLGQYDKIYIGKRKCESGKISCLLGDVRQYIKLDGENLIEKYGYTEKNNNKKYYENQAEKINNWKEFCSNGNLKLLKNISGDSWIVEIVDSPSRNVILGCDTPITSINFSWQEVLDKNTISIIENL